MQFFGIGTIGKDIELKTVGQGTSVCTFSIACNRKAKSASGERITDWIQCTAWSKTAEIISKYFHKGDKIFVEGDLQTRTYDDKDGKKVYVTDFVVQSFEFCSNKGDSNSSSSQETMGVGGQTKATSTTTYPEMDDSVGLPFDL